MVMVMMVMLEAIRESIIVHHQLHHQLVSKWAAKGPASSIQIGKQINAKMENYVEIPTNSDVRSLVYSRYGHGICDNIPSVPWSIIMVGRGGGPSRPEVLRFHGVCLTLQ